MHSHLQGSVSFFNQHPTYNDSHYYKSTAVSSNSDYPNNSYVSAVFTYARKFNYETETQLSPALQSFLETYTPPVVEEEVVSDANSFDVLNPLSYNGEFEAVHYSFSDGDYTVPQGKSLIIYQINTQPGQYADLFINDVRVTLLKTHETVAENNVGNIVLSPMDVMHVGNHSEDITFHGVLINSIIETEHYSFSGGDYTVPQGKSLIIYQITTQPGQNTDLFINDVRVAFNNT